MDNRIYICIDLKSFYASCECVERGYNPLITNLVVADSSRTEKTICLAVSPALKSFGIPGRARLFEVVQKVKEVNNERRKKAYRHRFVKKSFNLDELNANPDYEISFIIAPPQMAKYIEISAKIYDIYLKYISKEDIHVYSIDEVFIDATKYLKAMKITAHELALKMVKDVLNETGITATAGIGTNMYLAKVAMDIMAKKMKADEDGVRIAELDEMSYRKNLWSHKPLKDFWRVGRGYVKRLEELGLYTMGDIAKCSVGGPLDFYNEDLLYNEFGINAELLIDHAWGVEPTTIQDIKNYKPKSNSLSNGQVLSKGYTYEKTRLIVKEMVDQLALQLVSKELLTNNIGLYLGYDIDNLKNPVIVEKYDGEIDYDYLGRKVPKGSHGSYTLDDFTSSSKELTEAILIIFERVVNKSLLVKRVNISVNNLVSSLTYKDFGKVEQISLFEDVSLKEEEQQEKKRQREKDVKLQKAMLDIKNKFGKNIILKGMDLEDGATTKERNELIGGHKS